MDADQFNVQRQHTLVWFLLFWFLQFTTFHGFIVLAKSYTGQCLLSLSFVDNTPEEQRNFCLGEDRIGTTDPQGYKSCALPSSRAIPLVSLWQYLCAIALSLPVAAPV